MFGLGFNRGMIWHDGYLKLVSQSFYLGTRVIVGRFPDRRTDPYPTENRHRHASCPVHALVRYKNDPIVWQVMTYSSYKGPFNVKF